MNKVKLSSRASKVLVKYQDHPNGTKHCGACTMWSPPRSCTYVLGKISSTGYCTAFARKIGKVDHGK